MPGMILSDYFIRKPARFPQPNKRAESKKMNIVEKNLEIYQNALKNKETILKIVSEICEMVSTDCRSLNKAVEAIKLFKFADINKDDVTILEIPLDWDNQVDIYFSIKDDKNYYSLFAGTGIDDYFCFMLSIIGHYDDKECAYIVDEFDEYSITGDEQNDKT